MSASQPAYFNLQEFTDAGLLLVGGRLYTYAYGTTTQKTAYADPAGTVPHTYTADGLGGQYIALNARGELPAPLYLATGSYDVTLKRADGSLVWTRKADGVENFAGAVGAPTGAGLIGYGTDTVSGALDAISLGDYSNLRAYAGPQSRVFVSGYLVTSAPSGIAGDFVRDDVDVTSADNGGTIIVAANGTRWKRQFDGMILADWFLPDKTGVANATIQIKSFFDACIAASTAGHIAAGTYKITPGQLAFDNNHVDAQWPAISTDGFHVVNFNAADATDAPMIKISNGTALSGAGQFWRGGALGGLTFNKSAGGVGSSCHGLSLRGITNCEVGHMRANDLGGSAIYIEPLLYAGTNPDPYNVSSCAFRGAEGNRVLRYAFENQNYVGFAGNRIDYVRAINTGMGGFFGFGAGNHLSFASMGECFGWAFDDGPNPPVGGSPSRFTLGIAEIDGMEYGARLNRTSNSDLQGIRFIHRFRFDINTTDTYWPKKCIDLTGSASPNMSQVYIRASHRIEAAMGAVLGYVVGANPVSTVNGSTTVTYNTTDDHHFANGWTVAVLGAALTNGIPAAELNGEHVITVTGPKSFTYTVTTPATSSATGGGSAITLSPYDALGQFVDGNSNGNLSGIEIDQFEVNNAGFTSLTNDPTRMYTGISASAGGVLLTRANQVIGQANIGRRVIARGSANTVIKTVANAAIPADTSNLTYDSELVDRTGLYSVGTTNKYRVPFTGPYRVQGKIQISAAIGTVVNLAIIRTRAGVNTQVSELRDYQVNAGIQTYIIGDLTEFNKDDLIFIGGSQNTAGNIVASTLLSQESSNKFTISPYFS